jgi:hypothetical protein
VTSSSGTPEDRRAASNLTATLSGLLVAVALGALGAEAAVFVFVIDKRTHLLGAYIVSGIAVVLLVCSIFLGGVGISQMVSKGAKGNWIFQTPLGKFSPFNAQAVLVLVGGVLVVVLVFLGDQTSSDPGKTPGPPSSKAATDALGRYLHHRYRGVHGYWTCPIAQSSPITGVRSCAAEVRVAKTRHLLWTGAYVKAGGVVIERPTVRTWTRHWWPYSHHFIAQRGEPGVASVNSDAYFWVLLVDCAKHVQPGRARICLSEYDGHATGFFRFDRFKCRGAHNLVRCHNSLGDAIRYRPHTR